MGRSRGCTGRRESQRSRGRARGWPYVADPWLTVDVAHGWPQQRLGWPGGREWGCLRRSWGWSRAPGRERGRGEALVLTRARPGIGRAGRLWARAAGGEREGETRGPARWRVADIEAPRLARGEARGGRGTQCQRSGALPRAPEHANGRHPRLFARTRAPTCVWRL